MIQFVDAFAWLLDPVNWSGSNGIPTRVLEHLWYCVLALVLALVIAVPAGLYIGHTGRGRAVAIGLTQSPATALGVLAWILGIHQLEANLLNPKIMGDAAKIHPVLVIFSLLVGEHFFHIVGALLAVPCMSIAQSIFTHIRSRLQARDPEMSHEPVSSVAPPSLE